MVLFIFNSLPLTIEIQLIIKKHKLFIFDYLLIIYISIIPFLGILMKSYSLFLYQCPGLLLMNISVR